MCAVLLERSNFTESSIVSFCIPLLLSVTINQSCYLFISVSFTPVSSISLLIYLALSFSPPLSIGLVSLSPTVYWPCLSPPTHSVYLSNHSPISLPPSFSNIFISTVLSTYRSLFPLSVLWQITHNLS